MTTVYPPGEVIVDLTRAGSPASFTHTFTHDVAIVGLGYVGLPTLLAFHSAGQRVLGVDVSQRRLEDVRSGRADMLPRDRGRLESALADEQFELSCDAGRISCARAVMICVPTPVDDHLSPDLTMLRQACQTVVDHVRRSQVIILTSTSYVGCTSDLIVEPLRQAGMIAGEDLFVAFSPERIDPGNTRHAPEDVPRVVGGASDACTMAAVDALSCRSDNVYPVSSMAAAEMCKLVENTFRAVNVALANEFADISRALSLDVTEVIDAAATKPYGFMAFRPGPGVGGHCIPCDPYYLLWQLRRLRVGAPVIEQSMRAISERPRRVAEHVATALADEGRSVRGSRVLVVGVTYKPDVADLRESPAVEIIQRLCDAGAEVSYFDPLVPRLLLGDRPTMRSVGDPARSAADLVLVHTLHTAMDVDWLRARPLVVDATYKLAWVPQARRP